MPQRIDAGGEHIRIVLEIVDVIEPFRPDR
jgi:hypothetical protein